MDEVIGEDGEISYAMNRQLQTELAKAMQKAKDRLRSRETITTISAGTGRRTENSTEPTATLSSKKENCRKRSRAILIKLADNRIIEQ